MLAVTRHGYPWAAVSGLQPSEFAKFSTCLLLARYLSGTNVKITEIKSFPRSGGHHCVPYVSHHAATRCRFNPRIQRADICIISRGAFTLLSDHWRACSSPCLFSRLKLESHWYVIGALVAIATIIILLFRRNKKAGDKRCLIGLAMCIAFVFSVKFLYNDVLKPHQKSRIDIVLGITKDLQGQGL